MLPFKFVGREYVYDDYDAFYARIDPKIQLADELLKSFYYLLWFPGYFGFNWNALYDCLRDLSWIPCRKIVVVHQVLPELSMLELKLYIEVLRDSILDWEGFNQHELEVIFPSDTKAIIEKILSS